jgi:hypothetical protein
MQTEGCQRGRARVMLPKTNFPNRRHRMGADGPRASSFPIPFAFPFPPGGVRDLPTGAFFPAPSAEAVRGHDGRLSKYFMRCGGPTSSSMFKRHVHSPFLLLSPSFESGARIWVRESREVLHGKKNDVRQAGTCECVWPAAFVLRFA